MREKDTGSAKLHQQLATLAAPLRFARQQAYQHLQRIKGLEQQLMQACRRLLDQPVPPALADCLQQFLEQLPPSDGPLMERQQALERCWQMLQSAQRLVVMEPPSPRDIQPLQQSLPQPVIQIQPRIASEQQRPLNSQTQEKTNDNIQPRAFDVSSPLQAIQGLGSVAAAQCGKKDLWTVQDLLMALPRGYRHVDHVHGFATLQEQTHVVVQGDVVKINLHHKGQQKRLEVVLQDDTGCLSLWWFRLPRGPFVQQFRQGARLQASGVAKRFGHRWQLIHPTIQHLGDLGLPSPAPSRVAPRSAPKVEQTPGLDDNLPTIVPIYSHVEGIHPNQYRRWLEQCLPLAHHLPDPIPPSLLQRRQLPSLQATLQALHQPPPGYSIEAWHQWQTPWQQRMIYQELLLLQSWLLRTNRGSEAGQGYLIDQQLDWLAMAAEMFPFTLTPDQQRLLCALQQHMGRRVPVQQLIQGDVGSGKTAIALVAAAGVARSGYQVALLAPTELLARQHALKAEQVLAPMQLRSTLLTGSLTSGARRKCYQDIAAGTVDVVIGTQALLQEKVQFAALGLLIVDEQHRFGVMQRAKLTRDAQAQQQTKPHVLIMTATPIPRTLALTLYGDLDIGILKSRPPNRKPILTTCFRHRQREQAYLQVRQAVEQGQQAYVVFPLVEPSELDQLADLQSATQGIEDLMGGLLAGLPMGLLHGQMHAQEKMAVMQQFQRGTLAVLVATTVIEVGIDIPNATVMVIEHAERYGLSQLHQLRGRVGRGARQSYCYLLAGSRCSQQAWHRLQILAQNQDGFQIAEQDLALRGPGDVLGTKQAGMPSLTLAHLSRDGHLVAQARLDARQLLADDPDLQRSEHQLWRHLLTDYAERHLALAKVG